MSEKKYHDGGYVSGPAPQILPVGDCHQLTEFQQQIINQIAASMGISYDQLRSDYEKVEYSATAEQIKTQQAWAEVELRRKFPNLRVDPRIDKADLV